MWEGFLIYLSYYSHAWQSLSDDVYSIQYYVINLSVTCGTSVGISAYSDFQYQQNWLPRYNWNIVESGAKHHNLYPNPW